MENTLEKAKEKYEELFSIEEKAKAFDKIAAAYYFCNFGEMQKVDFETLLFSIYLERILEKDENDMRVYSDYALSKCLGITQSKISNLKVRKQLKYPYQYFDWRKSFERISSNARYENGKIKINIPDRNLYLEIKNAVEASGGYVETQLSQSLLQIRPEYFLDLLMEIVEDKDRNAIKKDLKKKMKEKNLDMDFFESKSIGDQLKDAGADISQSLILDLLEAFLIPAGGNIVTAIVKNIRRILK
ncbi:hypothetical protein ACPW7J_05730 [Ihubacter sp. rT4E-8]|uniref:hypothetical protein n=1 Tax=Ihubacter sp. rT4E-8 TaxID=3242369 RepID=UPI003CF01420